MFSNRIVSQVFHDVLSSTFPQCFSDSQHPIPARFLQHLLFGQLHFHDSETLFDQAFPLPGPKREGFVLCDRSTLAQIAGCESCDLHGHFHALEFLGRMQLVTGFPLEITDYNYKEGLAREVRMIFPADLLQAAGHEMRSRPVDKITPVYFSTGQVWKPSKAMAPYNRAADAHYSMWLDRNHNKVSPLSLPILNYMRGLTTNVYAPFLPNVAGLIEEVQQMPTYTPTERYQRDAYLRNLIRFEEVGTLRPVYKPGDHSPRVYAMGYSLLSLPRDLRRRVLVGTLEADLSSAHMVIAAYDLDIPSMKALFMAGHSFWTVLLEQTGAKPEDKPVLKKAIYSVLYGASRTLTRTVLERIPEAAGKAFFKAPLVKDLYTARNNRLSQIEDDSGISSLGEWLELTDFKSEPHTLLSIHAQRIETYVISACYEEAARATRDFRILSAEHDGFTLQILRPQNVEGIKKRLRNAVSKRGKGIGIPLQLEFKD